MPLFSRRSASLLALALFVAFPGLSAQAGSVVFGLSRGTGVVSVVGRTAGGLAAIVVGPYGSSRSVTLYLPDTSDHRAWLPGDSVVFEGRITWLPSGGQAVIERRADLEFVRRLPGFRDLDVRRRR